jgi:hypothetical protein
MMAPTSTPPSRKKAPRTVGAVTRPELCELLRIEAFQTQHGGTQHGGPDHGWAGVGLDFFNDRELTARHVEHTMMRSTRVGDVFVAVPLPEAVQLLTRLARRRFGHTIYLQSPAADEILDAVRRRIRNVDTALNIVFTTGADAEIVWDRVSCAIVGGTGPEALTNAMAVSRRLTPHAKVIAIVADSAHLAPLLDANNGDRTVPIEIVDPLRWWRDSDLILGGTVEIIARATHDNYVATRASVAPTNEPVELDDPATVSWGQLPEDLKKSNRDQARHLWVKLAAIGCVLAPNGGESEPFMFGDDEIDRLAQLEHQRWVRERRANGWTSGERNIERKTTPYLVGWDQLTEEVKDLDRAAVVGLPAFVNDVGYRIVRQPSGAR